MGLRLLGYGSVPSLKVSDHRAVRAAYALRLPPGAEQFVRKGLEVAGVGAGSLPGAPARHFCVLSLSFWLCSRLPVLMQRVVGWVAQGPAGHKSARSPDAKIMRARATLCVNVSLVQCSVSRYRDCLFVWFSRAHARAPAGPPVLIG